MVAEIQNKLQEQRFDSKDRTTCTSSGKKWYYLKDVADVPYSLHIITSESLVNTADLCAPIGSEVVLLPREPLKKYRI